jgi:hypothetical protein
VAGLERPAAADGLGGMDGWREQGEGDEDLAVSLHGVSSRSI